MSDIYLLDCKRFKHLREQEVVSNLQHERTRLLVAGHLRELGTMAICQPTWKYFNIMTTLWL